MMDVIRKFFAATFLFAMFSISSIANAALVGRLAIIPGGTDYQAYYDTEADLTWLADANAAVGSIYDTYIPGSGRMNWTDANTWASGLDINGVTGWRLPDTLDPDSNCSLAVFNVSGGLNCTGSEMGNLFYNVLGGVAGSSITITHNTNYDLFSNIQTNYEYWSATEVSGNTTTGWRFAFSTGDQGNLDKDTGRLYAWAVYDGDISAVPVPAAAWLFGSGLLGLIGIAKRKKA